MPNSKPRVSIPTNPAQKLDLAARIYAKHLAEGANSTLNALQSHNWTVNGPEVANAISLNQQAEDLQRQTDLAYRKRDLLLAEIDESIKSSRDLLLSLNRDNPKELNQWGFDVSDTARSVKKEA
ncbi:MAG TPA: hypothetical protein VFK73_06900 [Paludibacter sp.]|nr:hypothetical protein [Paludibacter sp.]